MNYREEYERWLSDFKDDKETIAELLAIANDEKEIEDRFYTNLSFGTAGMRGVLGAGLNRMNVYTVRRVTRALGTYICRVPEQARRGVVIAYDSRHFSDIFAKQAALVLCNAGVKVYLFDSLRPVPVLSYSVRHLGAIAGIVITASHNTAIYNGFKAYWEDGGQMPPERASAIEELTQSTSFAQSLPMDEAQAKAAGLLTTIGGKIDDDYIGDVKRLCVNPELARTMGDKLRIVYTPLHGAGNLPVRRILKEIGFTDVHVVPEQEQPDGSFPTVTMPNPEDPAAFTLALALQKQLGADLVFGTDPDCDRVGIAVLDDTGTARILTGNQIGCLLLHYIISERHAGGTLPGNAAAVKSIVSTEMAQRICDAYNVTLFNVLTGFKFIAEKIEQFDETGSHVFQFGFEESYGYLSGTKVRDKDGVNASMLIAECAAWYKQQGMTLYDALQTLSDRFGHYDEKVFSVKLDGKDGRAKMLHIMQQLRSSAPATIGDAKVLAVRDYQSGIRRCADGTEAPIGLPKSDVLYYELEGEAWICIRPSGTEPKIKLYVNAVSDSAAKTKAMVEAYALSAEALLNRAGG